MSSSVDPGETQPAEDVTRTRTSVAEAREAGVVEPSGSTGLERIPGMIGRYRVTGYLGRGGMGMVLSAHDTELRRPVALKLLHHGAWGDKASSRIEREAQAMAKLSHPNVVTVYEVGRSGDQPFIAMELVDGVTLREWLRAEKRSWRKTLAMIVAAGRGLAAAHDAGLVHRDFKPENVLVGTDGRPRVSDFGLVASTGPTDGAGVPEGTSVMGGTPAYMAPEQWAGVDIDARADQFAFAVTCWEALWGTRPFVPRDLRAAEGTDSRKPEVLRARRGVPRRVEAALRRALHPHREKRWPTLSQLLDQLDRIARDRRVAIGLVTAIPLASVAVIAFQIGGGTTASPCQPNDKELDAVWNPARQRALAVAFHARPESYARDAWADVQRAIDGWVADYHSMRVQACEGRRAGGAAAAPVSIARDRCLDRRRDELAALVTAFEQPDATTIQYARAAARGLTKPIACLGAQTDAPDTVAPPFAARAELDEIRRRLAEASTRRALGKPREAVSIAEDVARKAEEVAWTPIIAQSQLELALSYQAANANEKGERAHERAALLADSVQDDQTRFAAMIGLVVAAMDHSRYDDAGKAIESARMIARRLPPDERRDVTLDMQESILAFWRGDYDRCISRGQATLPRIATAIGADAIEGAILRGKMGQCCLKLQQIPQAKVLQTEGLAIAESTVGREHPVSAELIFYLGYSVANEGDTEAALELIREATAIRERVLGADNAVVGVSHTGVGGMLAGLGRHAEARTHFQRAATILEATWGGDSPALAIAESGLGFVALALGDHDAAERHFRRELAIRRAKRPPGHDEISSALVSLGEVLLAKRDREAVPVLREAVAGYDASPSVTPGWSGLARFLLGRALVEFESRERGMALIEAGCPLLEAAGYRAEAKACRTALSAAR